MSIIEKLASEGHLTEEQIERIGKSVAEFKEALDSDPALMKEAVDKLAFKFPTWVKPGATRVGFKQQAIGHAMDVAPMAAGAGALGAALGLTQRAAGAGVGAAKGSIQKSVNYKKMIEENPDLREADPNVTQKAFNTLHKFNPDYASDPMVAGTFVKNVVDQERIDIGTVNSLVQARKNLADRSGPTDLLGPATAIAKAREGGYKAERARHEARAENFGGQARVRADEEEYQAAKAKREFWEGAEAVDPNDPRVR